MTVQLHMRLHALEGKRAEMINWEAIGAIELVQAALVFILCVACYRGGDDKRRAQIKELQALVQLWKGRAERAAAGRHRKPELQVRAKTTLPPWTPTLTVVRVPQPAPEPSPNTITMTAVTTGGMRALTDEYIAQLETDGIAYRKGLTAS